MDLKAYITDKKAIVENRFSSLISETSIPLKLREAMNYSLNAGGKRFRPILVIAGGEAVGGKMNDLLDLACCLEMIHTFSLIHDDLPAMDDDSLRRGQPTNHKVYGEAVAILAGDALMAEAFYVLSRSSHAKPKVLLEIVQDVAHATGARGMTGGQLLDLEGEGSSLNEGELENIHLYKTGALIRASVVNGARLGGATSEHLAALDRYGRSIGLAFQITDDILDLEGDQDALGKDIGSDIENEKSTYPSIIGLEKSRKKASGLVDYAIESLSIFDERAKPLRTLARYIVERDR